MLSPDVPEFVPRNCQSSESLGTIENVVRFSDNASSPSKEFHHHISQTESNDSWRAPSYLSHEEREKVLSNTTTSWHSYNTRSPSVYHDTWRKATKNNWNSHRKSVEENRDREKRNLPNRPEHCETSPWDRHCWRDKTDTAKHETSPRKWEKWRAKDKPPTSSIGSQLHDKRSRENPPMRENASESKKAMPLVSSTAKSDRHVKQERVDSPLHFNYHRDSVTYKKVLNRKTDDMFRNAEKSRSPVVFQSEEEWPSLSGPNYQMPEDKPDRNVWMKDNVDSSSWPRSGIPDERKKEIIKSHNVKEGKIKPLDQNCADVKRDTFSRHVKKEKTRDENHSIDSRVEKNLFKQTAVNISKYERSTKYGKENKKQTFNDKSNVKDSISGNSEAFRNGIDPHVKFQKEDTPSQITGSEIGDSSSFPRQDEILSSWQVQKKRRNRVKEQPGYSLRDADTSNSANDNTVHGKRKTLLKEKSGISRHRDRRKDPSNSTDRILEKKEISSEIVSKRLTSSKNHKGALSKISEYVQEEIDEQSPSYNKDKKVSMMVVRDTQKVTSESNRGSDLKGPSAVCITREKSTAEDSSQNIGKDRKAKRKEEKMRKRELKEYLAWAQSTADSKVTMVSKNLLEAERSPISNNETFQLCTEDYPTLSKPKSNSFVESPREYGKSFVHKRREKLIAEKTQNLVLEEDSDFSEEDNDLLDENIASGKNEPSDRRDNNENNLISALPSYSGALLKKSPERKVVKERKSVEVTPLEAPAAKKKVKTKDTITFNLLDAAVAKKKKHKKNNPTEFDQLTAAVLERNRKRGQDFLAALAPRALNSSETGSPSVQIGAENSSSSKLVKTNKVPKAKAEVAVKRGKQREGKKKKKLSPLKKAMKRAKMIEAENLLFVLKEVKKLHEGSLPSALPYSETHSSSLSREADTSLSHSPEINMTLDGEIRSSTDISGTFTHNKVDEVKNNSLPNHSENLQKEHLPEEEDELLKDTEETSELSVVINESSHFEEVEKTKETRSTTESKDEMKVDHKFSFQPILKDIQYISNSVHNKKFREYCNHMVTPEVNEITGELIRTIVSFQERHYKRDPVKARIRRRYVCGLRATTKSMGKMSCIVVAPNIARSSVPGGLDEVVERMLSQAKKLGVPVIFALNCHRLGYLTFKKVPVSCIGIISYDGAQDIFHKLMAMIPEAQKRYQECVAHEPSSIPVSSESQDASPEQENFQDTAVSDITPTQDVIASTVAILNDRSNNNIASTVAILNDISNNNFAE